MVFDKSNPSKATKAVSLSIEHVAAKVSNVALNKHDRYVEKLSRQLRGQYDELHHHYPLYGRKCKLGEIDILGIKGDSIDVYEVKCSFRIVKASRQLKRIRRVLGILGKPVTNTYFYCGMSNQLMQVRV